MIGLVIDVECSHLAKHVFMLLVIKSVQTLMFYSGCVQDPTAHIEKGVVWVFKNKVMIFFPP